VRRETCDQTALSPSLHWGARADVRARVLACVTVLCALVAAGPSAAAQTPAGTLIENIARSQHVTPEGDAVEESSNPATTMIAADCLLDPFLITVAPSGPAVPGTLLTYTLSATNRTGVALPGVLVTLPVDAALTEIALLAASTLPGDPAGDFDAASRVVAWTFASPLPPDATTVLQFTARVRPDATADTTITVGARLASSACAANLASNTVSTLVGSAALTLTLASDRGAVAPGDGVGFTLAVANAATFALTEVRVTDTLPAGLRYVPGTARVGAGTAPDPAVATDGRTLTFAVADLEPGGAETLRFGARVLPTATEGEIVDRAVATATTSSQVPIASPASTRPSRSKRASRA